MVTNLSSSDIFNQLAEIFKNSLNIENLNLDSEINKQFKLDSIEFLTIITEIENHFEIRLPIMVDDAPRTINDLVNIIYRELLNGKPK